MRYLFLYIALLIAALVCRADELPDSVKPYRPVTAAYTLGVGSAHVCNTYLTPLHYDGIGISLDYNRYQAMGFDPEHWLMQLSGSLVFDATENPARNADMSGLHLRLGWAMMHRWRIAAVSGLTLCAGGSTDLNVGALLLARNGNNPAQAEAAWTIGATAMATYNIRIGRLPLTLLYQGRMPLTGVFFSPDYGELYYEIYMGNHKGLVHAAWPGNYFRLDNLLCADMHLGNTTLRVGYALDAFSSKAGGIVARNISHRLVLGVATQFVTIGRSRGIDPHARIISAVY